jgi:hypothetical protein
MKKLTIKVTGSGDQQELAAALKDVATAMQTAYIQDKDLPFTWDKPNGTILVTTVKEEEEEEEVRYILKEKGIQCNLSSNKFIELNEKIADEELFEYRIIDREDFIDELYRWIGEANNDTYKQMMKDDLDMLKEWEDEYIFSSVSTNYYISSNCSEFNETCEKLIELNESL